MKRSLRGVGVMFALGMGAIIITAATVVLYQVNSSFERESNLRLELAADDHAAAIARIVEFYREVASRLALQQVVQDMLLFEDAQSAQEWSSGLRRMFPDVVGVGLFTNEGKVLGDAASQLIGPLCAVDMRDFLQGHTALPHPPVHRENPALIHFDVNIPVRADDKVLGVAFISVSLDVLRRALEADVHRGEHVALTDFSGLLLAAAGSPVTRSDMVTLARDIPNTSWQLKYTSLPTFPTGLYISWLIATTTAVVAVIIAIILLTSMIIRRTSEDLGRLEERLAAVARGEDIERDQGPYLADFRNVMDRFNGIVDSIATTRSRLTSLSYKDTLTGLPNRRAFEDHLNHLEQSRRKEVNICLGIVDIDHFKAVNDQHGHRGGDRALAFVGDVLGRSVRQGDFVARLAGDEFVVVLYDVEHNVVQECFDRIRLGLQADDAPIPGLKISMGYVFVGRSPALQVNDALLKMDVALYEAKKRGRDTAIEYQHNFKLVPGSEHRRSA